MSNGKKKSRKKLVVLGLIALTLAGLGAYAYWRRPEPVTIVQTEKVMRRNLTELVVANGKIQPVVYVKISPEVSGEIIELPVKEGQEVKKGDLLMRIKPDTYMSATNSANAGWMSAQAQNTLAKANLRKAEEESRRIEGLFKNNLVSDSAFLEVKTTYEVAKATFESSTHQMENARANLTRALEDLAKCTFFSPLSGTISKLNSQLGERVVGTAMYQGTEVMTIADLSNMEARVDIGEVDIVLIKTGQKARLEVDAFRDKKFTGVVSEIANTAKSFGMGTQQDATKFEVRIRVSAKESFRPGMSVTAEVETRYRTNVITVPTQSVTTRMPDEKAGKKTAGKADSSATNVASASAANATNAATGRKANEPPKPIEVVFLVRDGKSTLAPVKRGISDDSYVEILEGLEEGQEVVSGGYKAIARDLKDGGLIKVDNQKKDFKKDGEKKDEEKK
jgi:HlyD family secretion protein